jgi:alpha-2-macroglobulin-like protein
MQARNILSFVTLAALAQAAAAGGTGSVDGTIMDSETGQVVKASVSVTITCGTVKKSATTDSSGHFTIANLPEGTCTLTTGGGTYAASSVSVAIAGGSIATILVHVISRAALERQKAEELKWEKQRRDRMQAGRMRQMDMDMPMPAPVEAAPPPMAAPPPRPTPPRVAKPQAKPVDTKAGGAKAAAGPRIPDRAVKLEAKNKVAHVRRDRIVVNEPIAIAGENVNGWAPVRVFPVPQYTKAYDGPRDDFRETIYWNPTVETDAAGNAEVTFVTSDAVTAFRATAEGFSASGAPGGGDATFQSKLPMTLDAKLPVEVTAGDTILLPVTLANETAEPIEATLAARFGSAFKLATNPVAGPIKLAANAKQSVFFALEVIATSGEANVSLELAGRGLEDKLEKTIRVVPRGFPIEVAASGTAHGGQSSHHAFDLAGALPGSIQARVTMYPSPVAAMTQGMEGMLREPGGCFEQTSSSNYPNVMLLAYLGANDAADPKLVENARGKLDRGYKLLTGYETPEKGYEWFGHQPGHEALTAYGLMEFADMAKVHDVDAKMMERTADWLMSRRDQKGGFLRSAQALDSFGRANETTTNAYIMWALAEAKRTGGLGKELDVQKALGRDAKDPYLLALAANTNLLAAAKATDTAAMVKRLAGMQSKDGSFTGAQQTITMSGGESLAIETTALATLALIKASPKSEYEPQIRAAVDWLNTKRGGYGAWGNTQATILGLKALTAYSEHARTMQVAGKATLIVNGKPAGTIAFEKGRRESLVWDDVASKLTAGKNTVEVRLEGQGAALPYTITLEYRSNQPQSSPKAAIAVSTQLLKATAKMGDGVTLRAHVENTTNAGVPMTLARIGLPGGMVFQTWQLKELRDKGLIDFYETRPREVILYWRALPPSAKKDVDINLLANVPGTYEAPASSAYLYYTAEDKAWTKPVAITIAK